jgi:hypothetical protein
MGPSIWPKKLSDLILHQGYPSYEKYMMIYNLIDSQWTEMLLLAFGVTMKVFTPCLVCFMSFVVHGVCSSPRWSEMDWCKGEGLS